MHIVKYIAKDSPAAAERLGTAIFDHTEVLRSFPLIGPPYPRGGSGRKREIVYGNYRIFYRVKKAARLVEILAVWHAARDEPESL